MADEHMDGYVDGTCWTWDNGSHSWVDATGDAKPVPVEWPPYQCEGCGAFIPETPMGATGAHCLGCNQGHLRVACQCGKRAVNDRGLCAWCDYDRGILPLQGVADHGAPEVPDDVRCYRCLLLGHRCGEHATQGVRVYEALSPGEEGSVQWHDPC